MKYEIERRDRKIPGTFARLRIIGESSEESKILSELESDLGSAFGANYSLEFSGCGPDRLKGGNFVLEYCIKKVD